MDSLGAFLPLVLLKVVKLTPYKASRVAKEVLFRVLLRTFWLRQTKLEAIQSSHNLAAHKRIQL
jgi:hypothetical protein